MTDQRRYPDRFVTEMVGRLLEDFSRPLLPWPELPQDHAYLAFLVDDLRKEAASAKAEIQRLQATVDQLTVLGGQVIKAEADAVRELEVQRAKALGFLDFVEHGIVTDPPPQGGHSEVAAEWVMTIVRRLREALGDGDD